MAEIKNKFVVTLMNFTSIDRFLTGENSRAVWPHLEFAVFQIGGTFILLTDVTIRFMSVLTPGKHFALDLGVNQEKEPITTGLYRRLKHPSYTGEIISFPGVGLVFQHFPASLFITVFLAGALFTWP